MHTAARILAPLLLTLGLLGVAPSAHADDEAPVDPTVYVAPVVHTTTDVPVVIEPDTLDNGPAADEVPTITVGDDGVSPHVPSNATRGRSRGTLEAGWVRAACSANAHGVRCALRFPEGARVVELDHRIGGQRLTLETSYVDRAEQRRTFGPRRQARANLAGVRLACDNAGQRVACVIDYPATITDVVVTTFVRGWNYGGIRAEGVVL